MRSNGSAEFTPDPPQSGENASDFLFNGFTIACIEPVRSRKSIDGRALFEDGRGLLAVASRKGRTKRDRELEEAVQTLERVRPRVPRMFRVVLHNDDYTTQGFVVQVLIRYFRKETSEAHELMRMAHASGAAVVGVYTRDIAETRIKESLDHARHEGHPLLLTAEPQG